MIKLPYRLLLLLLPLHSFVLYSNFFSAARPAWSTKYNPKCNHCQRSENHVIRIFKPHPNGNHHLQNITNTQKQIFLFAQSLTDEKLAFIFVIVKHSKFRNRLIQS